MRLPLIRLFAPVVVASAVLATPAIAAEPSTRVFGSASAAVMGGIVAGPIGLVAGAIIGYALGPTLTGAIEGPPRRVVRRRVRRAVAVAAAEPVYPGMPQAYAQQPGMQQPIYMAQQTPVPPPGMPYPVAQTPLPPGAGQPQAYSQTSAQPPAAAQRPAMYAAVPMPAMLTPGGNYAARAYAPQDAQATEPLR